MTEGAVDPLAATLIPAIVAGLLALAGSWAGAQFALKKFKDERAFEHQVEWYLDTIDALYDGLTCTVALQYLLEHGDEEEQKHASHSVALVVERLGRLRSRAYIFASQNAAEALEQGITSQQRLTEKVREHPEPETATPYIKSLQSAFQVLVADARGHLGIGALDTQAMMDARLKSDTASEDRSWWVDRAAEEPDN